MTTLGVSWKLALVARLDAVHTCLSTADHNHVRCALDSPPVLSDGESDARTTMSTPPDTHLDRYKRWKLDDLKIEELTSVRRETGKLCSDAPNSHSSSMLEAVKTYATDLSFFARGKRGVLFGGQLRRTNEPIVVKFAGDPRQSSGSTVAGCWVETEAKWIRLMNTVGIGARLETFGIGWLICERLDGQNIVDFLSTTATPSTARWALREILLQCFTMDMMGINKEEMTHPTRHIIIHKSHRRWRCTFIDFEKCQYTKKPKNVTQLCQFISSPRMTALLQAKGVTWDIHALRQQAKRYKLRISSESFGALLTVFKV